MARHLSSYLFSPLLWLVLTLFGQPAMAATFTVTNLNDSGPGSLRQAIIDANAAVDDDAIVFQSSLNGTIALTSGELTISSSLTINGPGANVLAVSGNKASRIFKVDSGTTATVDGLTITDGHPSGGSYQDASGGGIFNGGTLTVSNSALTANATDGEGGGIYNSQGATLTIRNSITDGQSHRLNALNAGGGGGVANRGTLIVIDSALFDNWAVDGGGIINGGTAAVINSTVSGNRGIGGIFTGGALTVINSTLSDNFTIWDGGGICNSGGTVTVINSTLSGNTASNGGGIFNFVGGELTLGNSIVAGNIAQSSSGKEISNGLPEIPGIFTSQGHNLLGENGVSGVDGGSLDPSDIVPTVGIGAILAPLGNYGGPTQTHLLVPGSPAINAGDNALIPSGVTTDQRGFPRIQGGIVDIGAVEVGESGTTDIPTLSQWALLLLGLLLASSAGLAQLRRTRLLRR